MGEIYGQEVIVWPWFTCTETQRHCLFAICFHHIPIYFCPEQKLAFPLSKVHYPFVGLCSLIHFRGSYHCQTYNAPELFIHITHNYLLTWLNQNVHEMFYPLVNIWLGALIWLCHLPVCPSVLNVARDLSHLIHIYVLGIWPSCSACINILITKIQNC